MESRQQAESHAESQGLMEIMNSIREMKGLREDDENGLMAMLREFMRAGGPPRGEEMDDSDALVDWDEYNDHKDEDDKDTDEDDNLGESNQTRPI